MLIICYRIEELVTLHYGNFSILGEQVKELAWRTGCSNWVASQTLQGQLFLDEIRREHPGWSTTHKQELGLFLLECMLHNAASMWSKEHQRCSQALQPTKVTTPEHPFMMTILGSPDAEILKVSEQVYKEECAVTPNTLPHRQQDEYMRELCQVLTKCMARAGLQVKSRLARPIARGRRGSHSLSVSWASSPSAGTLGDRGSQVTKRRHPCRTIRVEKTFPF